MRCEEIEPIVEAIADGTAKADGAASEHLSTCAFCAARVAQAREIDRFLASRDTPQPPGGFTSMVMARIATERWRSERFVDLGFNLAIAAGVIVILASAAGTAWSLGMLTIRVDLDAIANALAPDLTSRVLSQAQTVGLAAGVLTMALVLWWWAETESV
jgi:anti-sigma factor RsiW